MGISQKIPQCDFHNRLTTSTMTFPSAPTEASIDLALATRDLMADLRSAGQITGDSKPFQPRDRTNSCPPSILLLFGLSATGLALRRRCSKTRSFARSARAAKFLGLFGAPTKTSAFFCATLQAFFGSLSLRRPEACPRGRRAARADRSYA
jgi:hypothetical protein